MTQTAAHTAPKQTIPQERIAVIGLGFVGLPLAATFAEVGFQVTGVDVSPKVLESLHAGKSHFTEAGLQALLDRHLEKRLRVTNVLPPREHEVYIITVGTPVDPKTTCPILTYVEAASTSTGKALKKGGLVILRSTVPVGATREICLPILERESGLKAGVDFGLVFAPERLIAGKALEELRSLPQIVGGMNSIDAERAAKLFKHLTEVTIDVGSPEAAEMAKIIDNTYRDLRFAYANQMALLCEAMGLDMVKLAHAVNFGYERNQVPVPSPGVGGACLSKDPYILAQASERYGLEPKLTKAAREINETMPRHVVHKVLGLLKKAGKEPKGSTVFVLGFAFKGKPETSDVRDSPTVPLVEELLRHECTVAGHDPVVPREDMEALGVRALGIEEGFRGADAAILMTNHEVYEKLNIIPLLESMKLPAVFIDGWHLFEPQDVRAVPGIFYGGVGND
jgi:nucleotide sugar dehydrogenase